MSDEARWAGRNGTKDALRHEVGPGSSRRG